MEVHNLIVNIWREEKLSHAWEAGVTSPTHEKRDKLQCNNYEALLCPAQCIKYSQFYTGESKFTDGITGDYNQCGVRA